MILIYSQGNKVNQQEGVSGDVFLAMRRFVPDFKDLQGNAKVTLAVKRYPQQSDTTTSFKSLYN